MKHLKFLEALTECLGSSEGMTDEEVRRELEEEGVDVDAALERTLKLVEKLKGEKPMKQYQIDLICEALKRVQKEISDLLQVFQDINIKPIDPEESPSAE